MVSSCVHLLTKKSGVVFPVVFTEVDFHSMVRNFPNYWDKTSQNVSNLLDVHYKECQNLSIAYQHDIRLSLLIGV